MKTKWKQFDKERPLDGQIVLTYKHETYNVIKYTTEYSPEELAGFYWTSIPTIEKDMR